MDKHNNFHYLFRKRRGVESPSLKLSDSVYIPKNSSEIIMSSLKNLDMEQLLKHDIIQKMNSDQTNDFHFYDIPVFFPKEESNTKEKLKKKQEFKSIHNNVDLLQHKTFSSKIIEKPKYTDIEKNVRNALKKDGSLMMLNEM